ncbi:helix-turn-helix transcriptional regulator [Schaalia naturae]|jgi:transcriptional regulator with XRE-family HTH domain|uniref:Helix-turn-helix transcriptional regulator n=1 Tax=Schaalia naturae TaxID=635203 RepID=A0ABW2SQ86_9ACTO
MARKTNSSTRPAHPVQPSLPELPGSEAEILDLVEPAPEDDAGLIVDADAPDLPARFRARREELGLTLTAMAQRAGVSDQTWRNYETGRTAPRDDKAPRIWAALGWKLVWPDPWEELLRPDEWGRRGRRPSWLEDPDGDVASFLANPDGSINVDRVREFAASTGVAQGLPDWDQEPEAWENSYSPLLAGTLGVEAARTFALGADLFRDAARENAEEMSAMPRGTHLGQLGDSIVFDSLPRRWAMHYDYDFLYRLLTQAEALCDRLVVHPVGADEALVHCVADALVLDRILGIGSMIATAQGHAVVDRKDGWYTSLTGSIDILGPLFAANIHPGPDDIFHVDHWFDPFDRPFVPDWGAAARPSSGAARRRGGAAFGVGTAGDDHPGATVTEFPRNRRS